MRIFSPAIRVLAGLCLAFGSLGVNSQPADGDVLVFGGTGKLGSEVVRALLEGDYSVTVFARPTSDRARLKGLPVSYVLGDVLTEADVEAALKAARFRVVIDALARSESDVSFYAISGQYIARWAAATGVEQVILHGSVGAGDSRATYPQARWPAMEKTMAAKTAAENSLIESGVKYTIIRNARLPRHGTPATGKARLYDSQMVFGAVTRADLGRLTLECVDNPDCHNKIFHAADESLPGFRSGPPQPKVRIGFANPVLMVKDLDESLRFYTDIMGYEIVGGGPIEAAVSKHTVGATRNQQTRSVYLRSAKLKDREVAPSGIALVHIEDGDLPQMQRGRDPNDAVQGEVMLSLVVEGLEELLARMKADGYTVLNELQPSASGKSRIASALDPSGIRLEMYEYVE